MATMGEAARAPLRANNSGRQCTPRMEGSGMALSSFVRRLCVSVSRRSRMRMYCLYLLISHGIPEQYQHHPLKN